MEGSVSDWPKLLSLAVHEFRTPVTVVSGYLRMLLRERAGPVAENQRKLLEEAEKSCGRLSALIAQMSELGQLLDGRQTLTPGGADLTALIREIPANVLRSDDQPRIIVETDGGPLMVSGDAARLRCAIESVVSAVWREIIDGGDVVVGTTKRPKNGEEVAWIVVGPPAVAGALRDAAADTLGPFDEWRGGCGLALPLARRVIEMHGGRLMTLPGERQRTGGVIELPLVRTAAVG